MRRRELMAAMGLSCGLGVLPWRMALGGEAPRGRPAGGSTESRRAFQELLDVLQEASRRTLGPEWRVVSPRDVAEGHRFLTHVFEAAIDMYAEADPERPRFAPFVSPTRKLLGDNPDAVYFLALLRGDRRYRIRGNTAGAVYTSFTFQTGDPHGIAGAIFATLNDRQFDVAADGSYELLLGPDASGRNAVELDPATVSVTTRHYFEREVSVQKDPLLRIPLEIEPLEDPGPPPPPDDAGVARQLRLAAAFVQHTTLEMPPRDPARQPPWVSMVPNQLGKPRVFGEKKDLSAWGAVDNAYSMGFFFLKSDQALVMEGKLPPCAFANVVLWNRFMQTFEYRYRTVSLNRKQMKPGPDGRYRIVLAHRDPGQPSWLDTAGRPTGTIFWRFVLPEGDVPQPRTSVVKLAEVARG